MSDLFSTIDSFIFSETDEVVFTYICKTIAFAVHANRGYFLNQHCRFITREIDEWSEKNVEKSNLVFWQQDPTLPQ